MDHIHANIRAASFWLLITCIIALVSLAAAEWRSSGASLKWYTSGLIAVDPYWWSQPYSGDCGQAMHQGSLIWAGVIGFLLLLQCGAMVIGRDVSPENIPDA
jgi:hypothetical protein